MKLKNLKKKIGLLNLWINRHFPSKVDFGYFGENVFLYTPMKVSCPKNVFVEENVRIGANLCILNADTEHVTIKKYTTISTDSIFVTQNHIKTVGIPIFLLSGSHINDRSGDITIEEDVWIGARVTVLAGVTIGRGCVIGAGSVVNKSLPPYSVAVGVPARIVKRVFTNEQILRHESMLYKESERFSLQQLEDMEKTYFVGMQTTGEEIELDEATLNKLNAFKKKQNDVESIS